MTFAVFLTYTRTGMLNAFYSCGFITKGYKCPKIGSKKSFHIERNDAITAQSSETWRAVGRVCRLSLGTLTPGQSDPLNLWLAFGIVYSSLLQSRCGISFGSGKKWPFRINIDVQAVFIIRMEVVSGRFYWRFTGIYCFLESLMATSCQLLLVSCPFMATFRLSKPDDQYCSINPLTSTNTYFSLHPRWLQVGAFTTRTVRLFPALGPYAWQRSSECARAHRPKEPKTKGVRGGHITFFSCGSG